MSNLVEGAARPVVLIADDDPTTRLIMREVLEQSAFDVVEASDGEMALRCYRRCRPDVMLLDVEMPHMDGYTVCKNIRDEETSRKTPICIMTGRDDFESADRAYHVGATDFISKPISWNVLANRVRYLLRASNALNDINGLMAALPDKIFVLDEHGRLRNEPNQADNAEHGDKLKCSSFDDIFYDEDLDQLRRLVGLALQRGEPQMFEHRFAAGDAYLETRIVARHRQSVLAIVRDVSERKASESRIYDLAFYDRLTGLPNRHLFAQTLDELVTTASEQKNQFAIIFIDLDRFMRFNDTLGHSMGDKLLKAVAERLEDVTQPAATPERGESPDKRDVRLARLGGDEFVMLRHDVCNNTDAAVVADKIMTQLARPFAFADHQFVVTPSIGIAIYPQDGATRDELLMNADSAMYRAKAAGRNNYKFYSGTMKLRSLHRLAIEGELRKAIKEEHFELYYQPKVDLATWTIVGAEALLRWRHAERGWISPADFIPVAEESGLILPLGTWVVQTACRQIADWRRGGLSQLSVSVNVSSQQVYSDDLYATVTSAVSQAGIAPQLLELEITESLLMRDVETTIATLIRLKKFGVGLSIDDFGTGYSSLSYLKRFPIDALKIDRSFVCDLHSDNDDAAICAAILAMAHRLDLKVVAEGVELEEQVDFLRGHACDQMQGYLFSKPLPVDEFEALALSHLSPDKRVAG